MRNFSHIALNGMNWSFEKREGETYISKGEKIQAFKDPVSGSVCIKFVRETK